jgi:hypothetical protein
MQLASVFPDRIKLPASPGAARLKYEILRDSSLQTSESKNRKAVTAPGKFGVVVIGRNEGQRLITCLRSVSTAAAAVYVDSNSTDGSVQAARELDADVVELDLGIPFTAARARNAGFARLETIAPDLPYVQFVDGDCELPQDGPRPPQPSSIARPTPPPYAAGCTSGIPIDRSTTGCATRSGIAPPARFAPLPAT